MNKFARRGIWRRTRNMASKPKPRPRRAIARNRPREFASFYTDNNLAELTAMDATIGPALH